MLKMGLEEIDRFCWFDQPGRHLLHELTSTDALLYERAAKSCLPDADRERRSNQERAVCAPAGLLRSAILGQICWHEKTH